MYTTAAGVEAKANMGLDDFEVLQPIGKGAFARVDKVRGPWMG